MARTLALGAIAIAVLPAGCGGASSTTTTQPAQPRGDLHGLVSIGGGRKLFLQCRGAGSPTVVLISGARGAADDWTHVIGRAGKPRPSRRAVFPEVARFTRVRAYDRPGTSNFAGTPTRTTPVPQPTTAQDGVADLHALLAAAKQPGPYVLVAHSLGGTIGYLYASSYPRAVSGLVFVDPGSTFLEQTLTRAQWARFVRGAKAPAGPKATERADYQSSLAAIAAGPVPRAPATVLTSDMPFDFGAGSGSTWPAWLAAQRRLAAQLHAKHVTNTSSGHYIAGEQPALVTSQIRAVVDATRRVSG